MITGTGLVVWQAAYLPYGEAQVRISLVENNLRFPGQYFDAESGLHYNWNRYYDAQTGRYISADPIGLDGGMNLYAYVGGNPVNYFDPEGKWFWIIPVAAIVGGLLLFMDCLERCTEKEICETKKSPKRLADCANLCINFIFLAGFIFDPYGSSIVTPISDQMNDDQLKK